MTGAFLALVYALGFAMTCVGLAVRRGLDALAAARAGCDPRDPLDEAREALEDLKRAALWPWFLWRPERLGPLYHD